MQHRYLQQIHLAQLRFHDGLYGVQLVNVDHLMLWAIDDFDCLFITRNELALIIGGHIEPSSREVGLFDELLILLTFDLFDFLTGVLNHGFFASLLGALIEEMFVAHFGDFGAKCPFA
jgi:hypothetical protein